MSRTNFSGRSLPVASSQIQTTKHGIRFRGMLETQSFPRNLQARKHEKIKNESARDHRNQQNGRYRKSPLHRPFAPPHLIRGNRHPEKNGAHHSEGDTRYDAESVCEAMVGRDIRARDALPEDADEDARHTQRRCGRPLQSTSPCGSAHRDKKGPEG